MPAWPKVRYRFFLVLVASSAYLRTALAEEPLLPPIRGPLVPASSFGEYRSAHYHGGLDFSTGGREGMPVQAPRGGWIYRV
ncbi:MAG TPA: M23 family peptidase, partial [Candidatus Eisenbacteria bacterium]|nr:M23 family peptidase [Candidatus Eisenbacteria bacterium]